MLVTQAYSIGHFNIGEDQALVLTLDAGNARYASIQVSNLWGVTQDAVRRSMSLNTSQASPGADGVFTFVLSAKDPGVANWLDPDGLRQGFLFLRWAAFGPRNEARETLSAHAHLVSLRDLKREIPASLARVNPEARRARALEREADYMARFEEWWLVAPGASTEVDG
jgi:hypothetical protein